MAREADLDLVEVAPNSEPPVCRIMDFGKFLYEKTKKDREARRAQTKIEVKEIRLRPKTNEHHRSFKVRDARRWLEEGNKVKVRIRFRSKANFLDFYFGLCPASITLFFGFLVKELAKIHDPANRRL